MTRYDSIIDLIGETPLVRLHHLSAGLRPQIYLKLEAANPGGSSKDRAALAMIRASERSGELAPGGTVVEATSGNTGIGLAMVAAYLGYRSVIFTSSNVAAEKRSHLAAYGAELRLVDAFVPKSHPDSLRSATERYVAEHPGAWLAGQYDNPANPGAHFTSTGPEIWRDTEGAVTHLVATVGTGGTITGAGRYLKQAAAGAGAELAVVGADLPTSSYADGDGSLKYIEGAGHFVHPEAEEDQWPGSLDPSVIDRFLTVGDDEAITVVRELARTDGILLGGSAGIAVAAALRLGAELDEHAVIVAIAPDSGRSYLSSYFDDGWLRRSGFSAGREAESRRPQPRQVTVRDLLVRSADVGRAPLLLDHRATPEAAIRLVETARPGSDPIGDDLPLLIGYSRQRKAPIHPTEVTGWTTLARLREAVEHHRDESVEALSTGLPARVGIDESAEVAVSAAAKASGPACLLVLAEGRLAGILDSGSSDPAALARPSAPRYLIRTADPGEWAEVGTVSYLGFNHGPGGRADPAPERLALLRDVDARGPHGDLLIAVDTGAGGTTPGRILGTAHLLRPGRFTRQAGPDEAELRLLAVLPQARRQGIADALMSEAIRRATGWGVKRLVLDTGAANNASQALYTGLGFVRARSREDPQYAGRLVVFTLDIDRADNHRSADPSHQQGSLTLP